MPPDDPEDPPLVAELPMSSSFKLLRSVRPLWPPLGLFSLSDAPYPLGLLLEPSPLCSELLPVLDPPKPLERPLEPLEPLEPPRDDPTLDDSSPMLLLRELLDEPLIPSP